METPRVQAPSCNLKIPARLLHIHLHFRSGMFLPKQSVCTLEPDGKQRYSRQPSRNLENPVYEFIAIDGQLQRLAEIAVGRQASRTVVKLQVPDRSVAHLMNGPPPNQRLLQGLRPQTGGLSDHRCATVPVQIQQRIRIARNVRHVDGVKLYPVAVPVIRILLEPETCALHAVSQYERPVEEQVICARCVPAVAAAIEILSYWQQAGKGSQLVEVRYWYLEFHFKRPVAQSLYAERLERCLPGIDGLGIPDRIDQAGIGRTICRVDEQPPGEHEVVRGNRLAVAPSRIGPEVKRGASRAISH